MDKCPYCERKFEKVEDFPLIEILDFKRLEIPEIIMSSHSSILNEKMHKRHWLFWTKYVDNKKLPREVLEAFRTWKQEVVYNELVYRRIETDSMTDDHYKIPDFLSQIKNSGEMYEVGKDLTSIVKRAVNLQEIQDTLLYIENCVGKEVRTKELFGLGGFNKRFKIDDYNDLSLSLNDGGKEENGIRVCGVNLCDGWDMDDISCASIYQYLAEIHYRGKIKQ